jgi:hypothetical protein
MSKMDYSKSIEKLNNQNEQLQSELDKLDSNDPKNFGTIAKINEAIVEVGKGIIAATEEEERPAREQKAIAIEKAREQQAIAIEKAREQKAIARAKVRKEAAAAREQKAANVKELEYKRSRAISEREHLKKEEDDAINENNAMIEKIRAEKIRAEKIRAEKIRAEIQLEIAGANERLQERKANEEAEEINKLERMQDAARLSKISKIPEIQETSQPEFIKRRQALKADMPNKSKEIELSYLGKTANPRPDTTSSSVSQPNVIYPIIADNTSDMSLSGTNSPTASDMSDITPNSSRSNSMSSYNSEQEQEQDLTLPASLTQEEFNNAIIAIKHLFNMKTINDLKLSNVIIKRNILKRKIEENTPQNKDYIAYIIDNAFDFYKNTPKSTIPFTEVKMFKDYIRYDNIKDNKTNLKLKQIYENFYEEYKKLGFSNSNIYLRPNKDLNQNQIQNQNQKTRKNNSNILCDKISQLIQPMYSNRTIPSQIPNLTKKNITKRVIKQSKIEKDKENAVAKGKSEATEEIKNLKTKAQEEISKLIEDVKKTTNTKETEVIKRSIENLKDMLAHDDANYRLSIDDIQHFKKNIENLEDMLKKIKGGTKKRISYNKKAKKRNKLETRKR